MSANTGVSGGINNPSINDEVVIQGVQYEDDEEQYEEEVMVEEEVTDDENEGDSEIPRSVQLENSPSPKPVETPKKASTPKKVQPSEKVKNMKMAAPTPEKDSSSPGLSPDKNPFPTFGEWSPTTLSQIEICFPILTGKNETTNELTRTTKPEARYWKAPIVFKYNNFTSETLRFNNVHIPFHTGKGYGSGYVYLCLPGFAAEFFSEAGKKRGPTKVGENSLVPEKQRWWKIANNVENVFGVINHSTKKFHSKSLETIFDSTNSGISCSVILSFKCKAATAEKEALRPTTVRTISVEIERGFINEVDINVQMPTRISREKPKADPVASTADVATDSLMKRLSELGL